ncbi:MAG: flagellar export protein FliJ [Deltaproteobacteria bacterium]|nr:flagellar export protein FliJ [Candidatus Anaeroferrophillus wilburensis]MBN2888487.1 flagellar export protein FliJ [Deltaproteobacteria bacterium]
MFHFNLETLLKYRRVQEDSVAREMRELSAALHDAQYQLDHLLASQQQHELQWLSVEEQGIKSIEISLHREYALQLSRNISAQYGVVDETRAKVEIKRLELIEKMKQRRLLERLKEKRYQEYLVSEYRQERKLVDELAVSRSHGRT